MGGVRVGFAPVGWEGARFGISVGRRRGEVVAPAGGWGLGRRRPLRL